MIVKARGKNDKVEKLEALWAGFHEKSFNGKEYMKSRFIGNAGNGVKGL